MKMENPDRRGQDPSASSEQVRTPLEKQRDFADAQPAAYGFEVQESENSKTV